MTKSECLEILDNIDWDNWCISSIFKKIRDTVHEYDDTFDILFEPYFTCKDAEEHTETILHAYGLYAVANLLSDLKKFTDLYVLNEFNSFEDITKDRLQNLYDTVISLIEEKGE